MTRTRICAHCGKSFTYRVNPHGGGWHKYCKRKRCKREVDAIKQQAQRDYDKRVQTRRGQDLLALQRARVRDAHCPMTLQWLTGDAFVRAVNDVLSWRSSFAGPVRGKPERKPDWLGFREETT